MRHRTARRLIASTALAAILALSLAGCKTTGDDVTGSLGTPHGPKTDADWRQALDVWGARYHANPGDADAAMAYAQALRATGQRAQAVAVLEQASIRNPNNRLLLGAYGRALADAGQYAQALDVLSRAHTPDQPGLAHPQRAGRGARPDGPPRRSAAPLFGRAQDRAERARRSCPISACPMRWRRTSSAPNRRLRRATAQPGANPKVRQNLALVVGLRRPLRRGRDDRQRRPAAGRGGRQCRLSAPDAGAAERLEEARPRALRARRQKSVIGDQ